MDWLVWICAKPFPDYQIYGCPMNMPCLTLIYKGNLCWTGNDDFLTYLCACKAFLYIFPYTFHSGINGKCGSYGILGWNRRGGIWPRSCAREKGCISMVGHLFIVQGRVDIKSGKDGMEQTMFLTELKKTVPIHYPHVSISSLNHYPQLESSLCHKSCKSPIQNLL